MYRSLSRVAFRVAVVLLFLAPAAVQAQGLLIVEDANLRVRLPRPIIIWPPHPYPRPIPTPVPPPASYKIKELDVQARLVDQVAEVQVSQTFVNTGSQPMEVSFVFPLPYDGAIQRMTLLIDGRELPAKLLDAKQARRMYEEIVRKNRDPALLEWMGTGLFRTSVFPVPPGASRTISLRYTQLCRKQEGLTDFLFPLSTAKYTSEAVERVAIRLTIESQEAIKNIYSPTHAVEIKRPDERHATVVFNSKQEVPGGDFRLFYDVGQGNLSTRVLSYRPETGQDGYFLLLASPKIKAADQPKPAKTVIFVIDHSGSMSGQKIEQVRAALKQVLNNLRQGDLFNIIAYDDRIEAFRPELQRFDEETCKAALGFVEGIYAGGMTNINAAVQTALGQLQDPKRPSYVIFLTDGLPTAGETNEMKIVANAKEMNKLHARIFAFGVGYDVNSRLLDKLVRANFGQSEYVRPNENIEERIAKLYNRIESPVMTGVQLEFVFDAIKTEEGNPINRVYPKDSFDLFAGEQLVVVGRYRKAGAAKVIVQGSVDGNQQKLDFPAMLAAKSNDESFAFIEKALGDPPRGRNPRPTRSGRDERRTGQGVGRTGHAARHPHAVHVVHGRRKYEPSRHGRQRRPRPKAARLAQRRRGPIRLCPAVDEGQHAERPAGQPPIAELPGESRGSRRRNRRLAWHGRWRLRSRRKARRPSKKSTTPTTRCGRSAIAISSAAAANGSIRK